MFIEIATGFFTLYSAFLAPSMSAAQSTSPEVIPTEAEIEKVEMLDPSNREEVEKYVRDYFSDIPILAEVARCESTFRHETLSGDVIRGLVNPKDVGLMQINEHYHAKSSKALGYDIHSIDGNL